MQSIHSAEAAANDTSDLVLRLLPPRIRPVVVLTAAALAMSSLSVVYSFGNLLPYLSSYLHLRVDASITTGSMIWLQTLLNGVPFSMLIGGVAEQALGGRTAALLGCSLYSLSIAMSSVAVEWSYGWLLVCFGLFPSFGSGIAYNAILITAQRWYPERVGLASGVTVAGFGCGAFFMSPLQTALINPEGFMVNQDGYFTQEELLDRVPGVFLAMSGVFVIIQLIGLTFLGCPCETLILEDEEHLLDSTRPSLSFREMLCSSSFVCLFVTLLCSATWSQMTSGFYKAYGLQFIDSDLFLSLVSSISAVFNCASRISWGLIADKSSYQLAMIVNSAAAAVVAWSLPLTAFLANRMLFLVVMCVVFCCVGGTYSLLPFASSRVFGQERFGVMYGLVQLSLSLGGIVSGLFGQFLLPVLGYDRMFLVVGVLPVISFIITAFFHLTSLSRLYIETRR